MLDHVGTGKPASQFVRQSKRVTVRIRRAVQDRDADSGTVMFETLGKVAEQLFSLVGIVQLPCLSQYTPD